MHAPSSQRCSGSSWLGIVVPVRRSAATHPRGAWRWCTRAQEPLLSAARSSIVLLRCLLREQLSTERRAGELMSVNAAGPLVAADSSFTGCPALLDLLAGARAWATVVPPHGEWRARRRQQQQQLAQEGNQQASKQSVVSAIVAHCRIVLPTCTTIDPCLPRISKATCTCCTKRPRRVH